MELIKFNSIITQQGTLQFFLLKNPMQITSDNTLWELEVYQNNRLKSFTLKNLQRKNHHNSLKQQQYTNHVAMYLPNIIKQFKLNWVRSKRKAFDWIARLYNV